MELIIVLVFLLGYTAIALEHPLKVNKAASAILTCVVCWTLYALLSIYGKETVNHALMENLSEVISIILFLLGAMCIVETIDMYDGFRIITDRINTTDKRKLLWIVSLLTFSLSAVLDNLTTTIVMVSLLRKLVAEHRPRMVMAGMVVIAANAGGAWTVIGDLTTTMLWIGGQLSAMQIMLKLVVPSLMCLIVPLFILTFTAKGEVNAPIHESSAQTLPLRKVERRTVFFLGLGSLLFVPVFKSITHLPPFMGILFGLSLLWIYTEHVGHIRKNDDRQRFSVLNAIHRMDMSSVFFFLGILLCINVLSQIGTLNKMSLWLDHTIHNENLIVLTIGFLSSIVDNIPLVAAAQTMYERFPLDHAFWNFLAYCAGTGGSILIIGSAAGVAAMGLERIDFIWYLKNISWLAVIGYLAGAGTYLLQTMIF